MLLVVALPRIHGHCHIPTHPTSVSSVQSVFVSHKQPIVLGRAIYRTRIPRISRMLLVVALPRDFTDSPHCHIPTHPTSVSSVQSVFVSHKQPIVLGRAIYRTRISRISRISRILRMLLEVALPRISRIIVLNTDFSDFPSCYYPTNSSIRLIRCLRRQYMFAVLAICA